MKASFSSVLLPRVTEPSDILRFHLLDRRHLSIKVLLYVCRIDFLITRGNDSVIGFFVRDLQPYVGRVGNELVEKGLLGVCNILWATEPQLCIVGAIVGECGELDGYKRVEVVRGDARERESRMIGVWIFFSRTV